jgi:hypothetical protein
VFLEDEAKRRLGEAEWPEDMPRESVEGIIAKVAGEMGGFVCRSVAMEVREMPEGCADRTGSHELIERAIKRAEDAQGAEAARIASELMAKAISSVRQDQALLAKAQQYGRTPEGAEKYLTMVIGGACDDLKQAVDAAVTLVMEIARETRSVAMLEQTVTSAMRGR